MIRIFSQYVPLRVVSLTLIDAVVLLGGLVAATWVYSGGRREPFDAFTQMPEFGLRLLAVVASFQVCAYLVGRAEPENPLGRLSRLGLSAAASLILLAVFYFAVPDLRIGRIVLVAGLLVSVLLIWLLRLVLDAATVTALPPQRVVVVGTDAVATNVAHRIQERKDLNMRVEGFLSIGHKKERAVAAHRVLGNFADIEDICDNFRVDRVVVVRPDETEVLPIASLVRLRTKGLTIEDANETLASLTGRISLHTVGSGWFLFSAGFQRGWVTSVVKRVSDLALATIGLTASLPVMAIVAVAILIEGGRPILYRQRRVGMNGKPFDVLKFRTMRRDAEKDGARWAEERDARVTRIGRFLRKYRFDEIPQYVNVIRGEMSFVGPRPERPEFVETLREQIAFFDERHSVRPGITGWAQVCHPYAASVEDARLKLEYDLFYLKNSSLLFDMMIVIRTLRTILLGAGR